MSDGEGAQSGATDGTQSGADDSTTGTTGSTETGTASDSAQSGATQPTEAESLKAELEKQRQRTQAADKRAAEHEAALKQLRDKDLPETEKLQRDFQDAQKQVADLQKTNQSLALKVAFLTDNTYTWHNPENALRLVDLSQVTIEEDGTVSGLKDALKVLATSNDYLVKKEATQEAGKPPATAPANNGASAGNRVTKPGAMAARLPVMRTRVTPQ